MIICNKCGYDNPDASSFCDNCGNSLYQAESLPDQPSFCSDCGDSIAKDAEFCDACGQAVDKPCPSCGIVNLPDALFCDSCGEALSVHCPNCHTKNHPHSKFCDECGRSFIRAKRHRHRVRYAVIGSAATIMIAVVAFIFWSGEEPSEVAYSYSTSSSQSSSSSPSTGSTYSEPAYEDFASIKFDVTLQIENNPKTELSCPSNVSVYGNHGDMVTVSAHGGDISGSYRFTYSFDDYETALPRNRIIRRSYSGTFKLDGKHKRYDVSLSVWGSSVTVNVSGY